MYLFLKVILEGVVECTMYNCTNPPSPVPPSPVPPSPVPPSPTSHAFGWVAGILGGVILLLVLGFLARKLIKQRKLKILGNHMY